MRVWLDDVRPCPPGWVWVKKARDAIALLQSGDVEEMSLDHDLGPWGDETEPDGYTVLAWLEEKIETEQWEWKIPVIHVHTRNPVGWVRMTMARERIRNADHR